MRLLVVAPTCDGEDVGEAWVAYQWVSRLAERFDLTVLTYTKRNHAPLSRQLAGLRVVEWEEPRLLGSPRIERVNSMLKPGYVPFFIKARRWIRDAKSRGERFTVGHQPTPVALRYPSPLVDSGIPYVLGPHGGSIPDPPGFQTAGDTAPWYVGMRKLDAFRLRHDRLLRRSFTQASVVLGIADYVRDNLADIPIQRFEVMPETAMDRLPELGSTPSSDGPLRLLFVGRVIRTKGVRDAVSALTLLPDVDLVFDVVGDGFDLEACKDLAARTGQDGRITFHGRLPRRDIDAFYEQADVFLFPSYREPGGNVVFEALSQALPLIIANRGGPANAADDASAIKIDPTTPTEFARSIANAVSRLAAEPQLRRKMSAAARRRAETTGLWEHRLDRMAALYAEVSR